MAKSYPDHIPADVPAAKNEDYIKNYTAITKGSGRLMLFAADQKMEHLNEDFYGEGIDPEALDPEHIFKIARDGEIGALGTHLGLLSHYAKNYPSVNYIAKLNGKTNLVSAEQQDPMSNQLWTVEQALELKKNGVNICGVGYTVYLGSEYEADMLTQAAQIINDAHHNGLVTVIWMYIRGAAVDATKMPELTSGATGVAASLGTDFVKIKPPSKIEDLKIAVQAAGNTKVICSGGPSKKPEAFLEELYEQIHTAGTAGNVTGRNIFQKSHDEAVAFTNAISAIVHEGKSVEEALKMYGKSQS